MVREEAVVHDSFVLGTEVEREVNADGIQAKGSADDTVVYDLGNGLGSAGESGYVRVGENGYVLVMASD
ncbi:MAG TPA: hypothetical protein VGA05_09125 [Candidatus Bathyarchaeia archaeon]|jgi:hypothetical protein